METFQELKESIPDCKKCPRLRAHCERVARTKKPQFRSWDYWGKPVTGFGEPEAKLWIIGLAPAAHGANRTGRMFTGDKSGDWLFEALHRFGFANQPHSIHREDGLELRDVFISAAARCAPPDNKPTPEELARCAPYLDTEFHLLQKRRIILALGAISLGAIHPLLARQGVVSASPKPRFGHGREYQWGRERVLCSYHPSQQNTQTGRLTREMWYAVFERVAKYLED